MSLDRLMSPWARKMIIPLALLAGNALLPYALHACTHAPVSDKGSVPPPSLTSPGARPRMEGGGAGSEGQARLKDLVLRFHEMICINGGYGRHSDYFRTASESQGMIRYQGKNVPVTIDVIPVTLPNIRAGEQAEYISIRTSDRSLSGLMIGWGTATLSKPNKAAATSKDAEKYLDMHGEDGRLIFIAPIVSKGDSLKITHKVPKEGKPGKTEDLEIEYNQNAVSQLTLAANLYLVDVWDGRSTFPGQLDYMVAKGDVPGSIGVIRSLARDRWGLAQYDPRNENALLHGLAHISGLELSTEDKFNDAFNINSGLPAPVPTPKSP